MRSIGHLDNQDAANFFSDYLSSRGVENELESHKDGSWTIWVFNEDKISEAQALLERFRRNPQDLEFSRTSVQERLREQQKEEAKTERRQKENAREIVWSDQQTPRLAWAFIIISCLVSFLSQMGNDQSFIHWLYISEVPFLSWAQSFPEVRQGQIWRLVTPIFMHFGPFHLLFNMLWLKDLGGMIEQRRGSLFLLLMIVVMAIVSNSAQYILQNPYFGGMSGVVYGLLGYVWMKSKYDPASGFQLHPTTVIFMLIWFVLGFTNQFGYIANIVHAGGLAVGVVWGYLSSLGRLQKR
jgi:GlpG protein